MSKASDDLPDPLSPVITTSWSRGIVTSMFLRLCSRAPLMMIELFIRGGIIACGAGLALTNPEGRCYHALMVHVDTPPAQKGTDSSAAPRTVSTWSGQAREQAVQRMFTSIARVYDLNNTLLSFGLHHRWKKITASYVPVTTEGRALDVGAGTADLALLVEPRMGANGRVIASDLNHAMLVEGLKKVTGRGLDRGLPVSKPTPSIWDFPMGPSMR